jgi:hypothetical protein
VAGDAVPTVSRLAVDAESGAVSVVAKAPGDGKVLRSSALMDERLDGEWTSQLRSPIRWHEVMLLFKGHLELTKDPTFTNNLLYWLLEEPRRGGDPLALLGAGRPRWQNGAFERPAGRRAGNYEEVAR